MTDDEKSELEKYTYWIASMVRAYPDIASAYFNADIPDITITGKDLPNYDRSQIEHLKLNPTNKNDNCKIIINSIQ